MRAALAGLKEQRTVEDAYGKLTLRPEMVAVKKCGRGSQNKDEPRPTNKVVSSFIGGIAIWPLC